MDVEHLHGGKFLKDGPGGEAGGALPEPGFEGDLQGVGKEGDEDVGLDPVVQLMMDGPQGKVAFEFFEGLLDFGELKVVFPKFGRIFFCQVGPQQVTAFATAGFAEFLTVDFVG